MHQNIQNKLHNLFHRNASRFKKLLDWHIQNDTKVENPIWNKYINSTVSFYDNDLITLYNICVGVYVQAKNQFDLAAKRAIKIHFKIQTKKSELKGWRKSQQKKDLFLQLINMTINTNFLIMNSISKWFLKEIENTNNLYDF